MGLLWEGHESLLLVHVLELQDPAKLVSAMVTQAGNSCSFANPSHSAGQGQLLLLVQKVQKGLLGDHMFKGSRGHRALGGAVLCNGQH